MVFKNWLSQRKLWTISKPDFEQRVCQRGNPLTLVQEIVTEVKFADRREALCNTEQNKQKRFYRLLLPTIRPHRISKKILMKHRNIIQQQHKLNFNQPPIVSHRKKKSLNDILVRAKISLISQQSQNQQSG